MKRQILIVGWGEFGKGIHTLLKTSEKLDIYIFSKRTDHAKIDGAAFLTKNECELKYFDAIILCTSSSTVDNYLEKIIGRVSINSPIISCIKGMNKGKFISQVIYEKTGRDLIAVISGPSFAKEMQNKKSVNLALACNNYDTSLYLKSILENDLIKLDPLDDVRGLEIAGVGKNMIALGAGMIDALNFGENFRSLYVARGIQELSKISKLSGGKDRTFESIPVLADIILTCTSKTSRNYQYGYSIATNTEYSSLAESSNSILHFLDYIKDIGHHTSFFTAIKMAQSNPSLIKHTIEA